MSSIQKNKKGKQVILFVVALVIFGAAGFLAYRNLMPARSENLLSIEKDAFESNELEVYYNVVDNLGIMIAQFEKHGNWPAGSGRQGKANPFLPYFGD